MNPLLTPLPDLTTIQGYEEPPTVPDDRVWVSQRLVTTFIIGPEGYSAPSHTFGAWDWGCTLCGAGTRPYPTGREAAVMQAMAHLNEKHPGVEAA